MKILVSGSTGFLGTAVVASLKEKQHEVVRLLRPTSAAPSGDRSVVWDPERGTLKREALEGLDAVVHLAGENIAARWTATTKVRIRDSRVRGTRLLCETLAMLDSPPKVLVSASAVGYYGDRGTELLTERDRPGEGFLAEVCRDWEAATQPADEKGIRVVHLRTGVVLSAQGGALAKMLTPFRLGLGGRIGGGEQFMSWIVLDDHVRVVETAIEDDDLRGPVNAVAPSPVTNVEFTKALGRVLSRPTVFPMPRFAAQVAFGEMADEVLLASTRVDPEVLRSRDYEFRYPDLEDGLRQAVKPVISDRTTGTDY